MKKYAPIIALGAFGAFLALSYFAYLYLGETYQEEALPEPPAQTEDYPARDFLLTSWEGEKVTLKDFAGKPVVLNFWASWCPPCQSEMPYFQEAFLEHGEEVSFIMADLVDGGRETESAARRFIAEKGYTFPVYFDPATRAASDYGVMSIPTTFFIDGQGIVRAFHLGAMSREMLEEEIQALLEE